MAYSIHKEENESSKIVLVFDLGDGTFDISILIINKGLFEELAISGDNHLGGIEFDNRLACYLLKEFGTYGNVELIIKCNTTIPAQGIKAVICCSQEVKNFTTSCDQQTTALIPIYEGERLFTKHNNLLSKFYLSNNPQVPKGELKISIIMDVDDNGILNV
ncbi:HSP70-domain-containing protein [Neocallimastix californiae]|uniref:HSP70-domain-containing protein n=1 Tax=Neocallimastix californiae TaxID=1754190 RepID=A0A1Y2FEB0_9FUNG|nr:HSP70-domain-containing protein [Neocallimastix californiae]|eukprot:ORY81646.1 HSP70-domain-containing protein [Neocallimastix californiae]